MNTIEFSNEFDILYNSIASMDAPALDEYEKSVFLTKAQLEKVKEHNGPLNKYGDSFEGSDKRRADMRELIVHYQTSPVAATSGVLGMKSYTASLPDDCFLIKYESVSYHDSSCNEDRKIDVVPLKYDEIHDAVRNPFRRPDSNNGFRLDIQSDSLSKKKTVELLLSVSPDTYTIRYVKYPSPIVLVDLDGISSEPLSVDGRVEKQECQLDEEFHKEILDRAVQLALLAYYPEKLAAKVQLDSRNN